MGMKKLLAVLFSALLLVGVAGCGGNNAQQGAVTQKVMNAKSKQDFEPVTEVKEGRKNVYAVLKVMKGNYWEEVIRGIKDGAAKADVNVYVGGVMKDGDWELQRDMVKELPGKKADAVILAPADSSNMTASAKTLREQKLPVFLVDTALSSNDYDAAFLTDNLEAGAEVCQQMVEQMKASGVKESEEATVLVHVSTLASWKIEHDYIINYGDEAGAFKLVTEKIKNTHNVKGIIACNNGSTNATVEAVMTAGRKDIAVTGFDLGKKTLLGLEDKNYSIAVAVQNQYKMGYEAVMAAAAAVKDGSKPAQKLVNTGIRMADKNNYKK